MSSASASWTEKSAANQHKEVVNLKSKKTVSPEQKKLEANLWIIALTTMAVYLLYGIIGSRLMAFCKDSSVSVWPRLFSAAAMEYGIAGLGITVVLLLRREPLSAFGLRRENALKAILGTVLCFVPYIGFILLSGQFQGYAPLSIMITPDLHQAGLFTMVTGTLLVGIVWGFFEGFNYAVIREIIDRRWPAKHCFFSIGALVCAVVGILFHPIHFDVPGLIELAVTFLALYGMLLIAKHTRNAWGCVFAFVLIWNAL